MSVCEREREFNSKSVCVLCVLIVVSEQEIYILEKETMEANEP